MNRKTQREKGRENTAFDFYELLKKMGFKENWMGYVYRNRDSGCDLYIMPEDDEKIIIIYLDFGGYPHDKYPYYQCGSSLNEFPKSLLEAKKLLDTCEDAMEFDHYDELFKSD